jgi:hydroxyacylglutathione hydrolase
MAAARRVKEVTLGTALGVRVVPVLRDNFSYVLWNRGAAADGVARKLALVDVSSDFEPVLREARALLGTSELTAANVEVWSTHKHHDHVGGNVALARLVPSVRIVGGEHEAVPAKTVSMRDGEVVAFDDAISVRAFHTPCHTTGHVLFHFTAAAEPDNGALFTGDTIFCGGLGAFFEGTASQMIAAMRRVAQLPAGTSIFPGHAYTSNFLKFASTIEPANAAVQVQLERATALVADGLPCVPSTIADELQTNVFMRASCGVRELLSALPAAARVSDEAAMMHLYNACP